MMLKFSLSRFLTSALMALVSMSFFFLFGLIFITMEGGEIHELSSFVFFPFFVAISDNCSAWFGPSEQ